MGIKISDLYEGKPLHGHLREAEKAAPVKLIGRDRDGTGFLRPEKHIMSACSAGLRHGQSRR
jgi:hypothetical protein